MRYALVTMLVVAVLAVVPVRAAETRAELLSQVQAADVLSDLLTFTGDRAAAREATMGAYLKEIDKLDAYEQSKKTDARPKMVPYTELFAGTVKFIKAGGDKYADPGLQKLGDLQLLNELNALQVYNVQQFLYLNQKREAADSVKAYLDSIKQFDAYQKWAAAKAPAALSATAPSTSSLSAMTPEQIVARAEKLVQTARDAAWQRAKAKGMSQSDFDAQWAKKEAQFKGDVAKRVEGIAALSSSLSQPGDAAAQNPSTPNPADPGAHPTTPQVANSWNTFGDPYGDAYNTTYQGAGVYRNFDTRVDYYNDQRVNGEYDRRVNLDFDRRENVQISVRQGV